MKQEQLFPPSTPEPERRSFHVRSHVTAIEAQEGEARAKRQEDVILALFQRLRCRLTPSEVWFDDCCWNRGWPLTSVRRALSNLTRRGLLIHYKADRRPGPMGSKESAWGLAPEEEQR